MGLLDGKNALICGVANKKSIAWGIAQALHAHGARLGFTCLENNVHRLNKLASQVNSDIIIPCDVRKENDIAHALNKVSAVFDGKLDILIHAIAYADINDLGGEFISISKSGWSLALEVSAYSLIAFARYARPLMNATGGGSIITLTFSGGESVTPGYNIMGIAKAALNMSVRYLAYDLGPENIRINAISAGPISTISSMAVEKFDIFLRMVEECSPLLRNITLEDLGGTAVYLASHLSNSVTGTVIYVDSGTNILDPPSIAHRRFKK
ncbi:MAG: enoyl-ACP reductase [Desulfobacteraceae bacterium]|nr:enoyl-ACP reductase [Desulfobacteraceae bacterium]MBC2718610.1 enoyl-ACP reductase [Desulfobacteraceae bacterium]